MLYPTLDTPALVVDLGVAERRMQEMQAVADQAGVALRPHTKTHKSLYFARRQLALGARGITVAKLGEAEAMADGGIDDILIAYPLVGELKLERLYALARRTRRLIVSLDSDTVAEGLSRIGEQLGRPVEVYVEIDTGLHRVGLTPGAKAVHFCRGLARFPGIRLAGLMSHAGPTWGATSVEEIASFAKQEAASMVGIKAALDMPDLVISVGATPAARLVGETPGVTEMRPGTYIFGDRNLMALGQASEADCALRVLCTVVSAPAPGRAVVDAGSKTLAADGHRAGGFGHVVGMPDVRVARLSEEHGVLEFPTSVTLAVGQRLAMIPNHVCPSVNLADRLYLVRGSEVECAIPIEGRGRNT